MINNTTEITQENMIINDLFKRQEFVEIQVSANYEVLILQSKFNPQYLQLKYCQCYLFLKWKNFVKSFYFDYEQADYVNVK